MFFFYLILLCAFFVYFNFIMDPKWLRDAYKGKNAEQKDVIRYFLAEGCLRQKMSDAEYDAYVASKIPDLRQKGMDMIGLDEDQLKEIEPVHFEGYVFDNDSYQKQGDDGLWRSSKYEVSWLFFSDTQVYLYKKTLYFDETKEKQATEEYFYKDITNFSTVSESKEVKIVGKAGKEKKVPVDTTQFKLVVPGDSFFCAMTKSEYAENAIQGMKAKLREKKQA